MKKKKRLILFLLLMALVIGGWIWLKQEFKSEMETYLTGRYPMDSFSVSNVRLSAIPPGAKGKALAGRDKVEFDVELMKTFFGDQNGEKKDKVKDNYYETRTRRHYESILAKPMKDLGKRVEAYTIEPIAIGEMSLRQETGYYPIALHILLNPQINSAVSLVDEIEDLMPKLSGEEFSDVEGVYFLTYPGAVAQSDLAALGYKVSWLTEPTATPSPSPTPSPFDPTKSGTSATTKPSTTASTTETGGQAISKDLAEQLFYYRVSIDMRHPDLNRDVLWNGIQITALSDRQRVNLIDSFGLSNSEKDRMERFAKNNRKKADKS